MKSSAPIRPPVWAPSRRIVPVVVARSIGSIAFARPAPNIGWTATPAMIVGVEAPCRSTTPDLVVVHALRHGHRERGEDPRVGQAPDRGVLDGAQVLAAVPEVRRLAEAVELEVDLDPVAELRELGEEAVVAGDTDAVRVEDDPRDVALGRRPDDLERSPGGLSARRPTASGRRPCPPSRAIAASSERRMCGQPARGGRPRGRWPRSRSGIARLQFSVTSIRTMQLCCVWRSPRPSR